MFISYVHSLALAGQFSGFKKLKYYRMKTNIRAPTGELLCPFCDNNVRQIVARQSKTKACI